MLKRIAWFLSVLWIPLLFRGQGTTADTIVVLDQVTISASRVSVFAIGQQLVTSDSLDMSIRQGASAGDVLAGMTSLHLKNYGSGTLTTLTMRGTSANHTGLLWNGVRISPPNVGYVDMSLIRADFFESISLLYGGASSQFGSGAIGGSVHLTSAPQFAGHRTTTFQAGSSMGSFGQFDQNAKLVLSGRKAFSRTSGFWHSSTNRFPYTDIYGKDRKLEHGEFSAAGAFQEFGLRLPHEQSLMAAAWFQYADRNIPPTMTEAVSGANQADRSIRLMAQWKDLNPWGSLELKGAWFNDFIRYTDPRFEVYSTISTRKALLQAEGTWEILKRVKAFAGSSYAYDLAKLSAYGQDRDESTLALFASLLYPLPSLSWKMVLHLRQEFISSAYSPFTFGFSAEGTIAGPWSLQASFSRNFRSPTMNERYWVPGGNPDLQPELSWNGDLGTVYRRPTPTGAWEIRLTGFTSLVDQWILWVPGENFWTAQNIRKVWARGVEFSGRQDFTLGNFRFLIMESYSYTRSTNENKLPGIDPSYQKQLIYTPIHKALLKTGMEWNRFGLQVGQTYTGKVFTSSDNTRSIPGYYLLDAQVSSRWSFSRKFQLKLSVNASNILDKEYQVTPFRPMPGINFLASIQIEFKNQKD